MKREKIFQEKKCKNCKNKDSFLCEIVDTIDGKCNCVYFKNEINKLER